MRVEGVPGGAAEAGLHMLPEQRAGGAAPHAQLPPRRAAPQG